MSETYSNYQSLFAVEKFLYYHTYWILFQLFDMKDVSLYIHNKFIQLWVLSWTSRKYGGRFYWEHRTTPWFYKQLYKEFVQFHVNEFKESRRELEKRNPSLYDVDYTLCVVTNREPDGHGMFYPRLGCIPDITGYSYIMIPPVSKYHCIDIRDGLEMGGLFYKKPIVQGFWESLMQSVIEKKKKRRRKTSLWRKLEELFEIEDKFIISGFLGSG